MSDIYSSETSGITVVKFGGSSLSDAEQFKKVAAIIRSDTRRRYVVPSAPGKRFDGDIKITDMLYECYDEAARGGNIDEKYGKIVERYREIIAGIGIELDLGEEFASIKSAFLHRAGRDYAASRGEYLNALILSEYLGYKFIDAAEVIFFAENGTLDAEKTNTYLREILRRHPRAVIPGFYGKMPNDTIKTFSRGGSDITGSVVARAAEAELYENWTDVSGFLMADPRIVKNPKVIETITYAEMRELSYMGVQVLHEDAIFPVRISGIPINIRNTNRPEDPGTMIVAVNNEYDEERSEDVITGIAAKKGFMVITIEKDMMNSEIGFIMKVLSVFAKHNISIEHLPSGIDTMSLVVSEKLLEGKRDQILSEICDAVQPDAIFTDDRISLLAVVGHGMRRTKGTASKVLSAIAGANINVRMIDQGSSELNIIVGVSDDDRDDAMRAIYKAFVN